MVTDLEAPPPATERSVMQDAGQRAATTADESTQKELLKTLHNLNAELERLRKQNSQRCRSSILAAVVVSILIVIILTFCIQAYRQLRASTDYLAWVLDTRLQPALPIFRT